MSADDFEFVMTALILVSAIVLFVIVPPLQQEMDSSREQRLRANKLFLDTMKSCNLDQRIEPWSRKKQAEEGRGVRCAEKTLERYVPLRH